MITATKPEGKALSWNGRRSLAATFAIIWLTTLVMPAMTQYFDGETPQTLSGWKVLLSGWIGAAYLQFGWYANLALAAVLVVLAGARPPLKWLRFAGWLLLLTSLNTIDLFLRPAFHQMGEVHTGYFVWMANNLAAAIVALTVSRPAAELP